jgi:CHAD domain-containing protein
MPVSTSRSVLLRKHLDRFSKMLPGLEQGDVTSLHRARVTSRRLRELLPTFQLEHPAAVKKLCRRLRKVTTRLGTVRELDVLLLLVDELHVSRRDRSSAVGRVGVAVAKKRDEARRRLLERLPIAEMRRIARKLGGVADELDLADESGSKAEARSWRWVVEARIAQRATRLMTAMNHAGAMYVPDRLHAVRIAIKKLRYALELSTAVAGQKTAVTLRALTRSQDLLGRVHDLQVLIDRVRKVQASLAPPNLTVWRELDALVNSLEDDCRRLHARYMHARDPLAAMVARLADIQGRSVPARSPQTRVAG